MPLVLGDLGNHWLSLIGVFPGVIQEVIENLIFLRSNKGKFVLHVGSGGC